MQPKKSLGQHFLPEPYLENIVEAAQVGPDDNILEIGSGPTNLTRVLLARGARVVSIELDPRFTPVGEELQAVNSRFTFVSGDYLEMDTGRLLEADKKWKVVANIPYYITSPILEKLLEKETGRYSDLFLLMQTEVAERIVGMGKRESGALTIFVRYWADRVLLQIPGQVFEPPAKVDSSLLHLAIRQEPSVAVEPRRLFRLVRCAFAQRRKMLRGSLRTIWRESAIRDALEVSGIEGTARPETLDIDRFARLAAALPDPVHPYELSERRILWEGAEYDRHSS